MLFISVQLFRVALGFAPGSLITYGEGESHPTSPMIVLRLKYGVTSRRYFTENRTQKKNKVIDVL